MSKPSGLPGERYIDIITRGCEHFGVDAEYTQWLRTIPVQPRRCRDEYRSLPVPENVPEMELSAIANCKGENDGDLCVAINGKVIKFIGDRSSQQFRMRQKNGGEDITHWYAKMLYEPLYPPPFNACDMTPEHAAWAEELVAGYGAQNWQVIGLLPSSSKL